MAPPSYVDIGSWARNVLTKGYHFGLWKIMCNAKTTAGLDLNSTGYSKEDDGKVFGQLDSKYVIPDYGLTLIEKWNTDNKLFAEVSCSDKIAEGVKVGIKGSYELNTREKEGKIFGAYSHENVKFDISCDIDTNGPNVDASLVLGYNSFLGGLSTQLNTQDWSLNKNNFALGYEKDELAVHVELKDLEEFTGAIYYRCADNIEAALQGNFKSEGEENKLSIGAVYHLEDSSAKLRAKINTDGQLGLGYQQKVRDGVTFFLCGLIEGTDIGGGAHKLGAAVEISA